MSWNDRAQLTPRFRIICEVEWDELQPSDEEGVRVCSRCKKAVFAVHDESSFERCASLGHCVFVATKEHTELIAKPSEPQIPLTPPGPKPLAGAPGPRPKGPPVPQREPPTSPRGPQGPPLLPPILDPDAGLSESDS